MPAWDESAGVDDIYIEQASQCGIFATALPAALRLSILKALLIDYLANAIVIPGDVLQHLE